MEVSKTDMQRIIKYLGDAALLYDRQPGLRMSERARIIRQLNRKLNKKLSTIKLQNNEEIRHR